MAEVQLIPLLRAAQRKLKRPGLIAFGHLDTAPMRGLARGFHSSLIRTDPLGVRWRRVPTISEKLVGDSFNMRERVQSKIPVLPWQEGYSFYNTYSSKDLHVTAPTHGLAEKIAGEAFDFEDRDPFIQHVREIVLQDAAYHDDSRYARHGILALNNYTAFYDAFRVIDSLPTGRHGLWTLPPYTDTLYVTDRQERHGILALPVQSDSFTATERASVPETVITERYPLIEHAEQHGLRNFVNRDDIFETASNQNNGTRTKSVTDSVAYQDEVYTRTGIRALAVQRDSFVLQEPVEQHGLRHQVYGDPVVLGELGYQRGGLRSQRVSESFPLKESVPAFRFDWRETLTVKDAGSLPVKLGQQAASDNFTLADRGTSTVFLLEHDTRTDEARFTDTHQRQLLTFTQRDTLNLDETRYLGGRVTFTPLEDPVAVGDPGTWQEGSPKRVDPLGFTERYERHGKVAIVTPDTLTVSDIALPKHGRTSYKTYDPFRVNEGAQYPPRSVRAREDYALVERFTGPPSTTTDYVILRESWDRDDTMERVVLKDSAQEVRQMTPHVRDALRVTDSARFQGTLDQKDRHVYREARILERPLERQDSATLRETSKLYRKSDFLEPRPDRYTERPRRERSAFSLVKSPTGELWAVWLGQGLLHRTARPYADSWRTHVESTLPAPPRSVRASLVFTGAAPSFVTQAGSTLIFEDGRTLPGVDPVSVEGQLHYLSADRRSLVTPDTVIPLGRRAYLRQSFSGEHPGAYLVDDFDRVLQVLGVPPVKNDYDPDSASARWEVGEAFRVLIPIEGAVIYGRD